MALNAVANRGKIVDAECYLHGVPGTVVTRGNRGATGVTGFSYGRASNTGAGIIFDTGGGFTEAVIILDLGTVSTFSSLSAWDIGYQLSDGAAMATPVWNISLVRVGHHGTNQVVGTRNTRSVANYGNTRQRFIFPITNDYGGTCYRYLRLYHRTPKISVASIDFGLMYSAFISAMP